MAHFYFHCSNSQQILRDLSGYDLVDLVEARQRASGIIRRVIETGSARGDWRDWAVVVTDDEDEEMLVVPFSDVIGRPH